MPIKNKLSDVVKFELIEGDGFPKIEMELRFARYELEVNHLENAKKFVELLDQAIRMQEPIKEKAKGLPKFYKG